MNFVDPYTFRARVQPALIVILPAGFLLFALLPDHPFFVAAFFGLLSAAGATSIVAQVGRDPGLKKQASLWRSWGGPPTTRLLRHRRQPGDSELAPRLRQQVEEWAGYSLPTMEEEEASPSQADEKYEEVVKSLLEATRDRDRFPLVFAEVVNYGFRRNIWGLRVVGFPTSVILASFSWALLVLTVWGRPWPDPWWDIVPNPDSVAVIRLTIAIANTCLAAFWVFWVKNSWVKTVADIYAKRLVESVQTLRNT